MFEGGNLCCSPERKLPADDSVDKRKNQQTMECETKDHYEDVAAQLPKLLLYIFHFEQLASNKEADSERGKVDDPGSDPHHDDADTLKEIQERLGVITDYGDGDTRYDAEHDKAKLRCYLGSNKL